jgi:hypothetical protein
MERRAFIRYAIENDADCRAPGVLKDAGWMARLLNISCTGIGLLMRHRFQPGSPLEVELQTRTGERRRGLRVKVTHATAVQADGHPSWLIGCVLVESLNAEELHALLKD